MDNLSATLKVILDKAGIKTELAAIQKIINKYPLKITTDLQATSLQKQIKSVSKEMASEFNKTFGTSLKANDILNAFNSVIKETTANTTKLATELQKASLSTNIQNFMSKNTAITKDAKAACTEWINVLQMSADLTQDDFDQIIFNFQKLNADMKSSGNLGLTWTDNIKKGVESFNTWISVITKTIDNVKKIEKLKDIGRPETQGFFRNVAARIMRLGVRPTRTNACTLVSINKRRGVNWCIA